MNAINRLPLLLEINLPLEQPRSCHLTAELVSSLISKNQAPAFIAAVRGNGRISVLARVDRSFNGLHKLAIGVIQQGCQHPGIFIRPLPQPG